MIRAEKIPRLAVLLLFLLAFPAGCSPGRGWEGALVLADIAAGSGPSRLKNTTPAPERHEIVFAVEGRRHRGDLYRPGEKAKAGLLLVPGAAEAGKDDPRLVAFATTLARARFNVLVPDIPSLRKLQVNPGNVREVADAFGWLVASPALAPGGKAGMGAFSYAVGPTVLAALESGLRQQVQFIFAVGGYHDLKRVLTFFTTGWFCLDGKWHYLKPNEYGKWVFVQSNLGRLADPGDRERFRAMAERKKADLEAATEDLARGLTPEGQTLYAFVTNRDPLRAPQLIEGLPPGVRSDLAALNLADKNLCRLRARLILVHGYDDNIIPYAESIALAEAVPVGRAQLFLANGLAHVDLEPGFWGRLRLWRAIIALLAERDRTPRPPPTNSPGLIPPEEKETDTEKEGGVRFSDGLRPLWYNLSDDPSTRRRSDGQVSLANGSPVTILVAGDPPAKGAEMAIQVTSSAFSHEGMIPRLYTCDGDDVSPPLAWRGIPPETKSQALIVDDPDAPGKTFVHWVAFNLPPGRDSLPEGVPGNSEMAGGGLQGRNDFGRTGYRGPCPPGGIHRYYFKLYALDCELDLAAGATKAQVLKAMEGHVLAQGELMGKYRR